MKHIILLLITINLVSCAHGIRKEVFDTVRKDDLEEVLISRFGQPSEFQNTTETTKRYIYKTSFDTCSFDLTKQKTTEKYQINDFACKQTAQEPTFLSGLANGLSKFGESARRNNQKTMSINCYTYGSGNSSYTNCY